jgi:hypothetical protein
MIRLMDWRDLAMLHRLRSHGLCLDSQLDSIRGPDAFHDALLDPFSRSRNTCTLIARSDDSIAVGQFTRQVRHVFARLTFLGPVEALSLSPSLNLVDALSQAAGSQNIHHLIAEIDEHSPAFELLRRAGFAVYARQRIWQYSVPISTDLERNDVEWRLETDTDATAIRGLYHNLVPGLVQQVEAPPSSNNRSMVHWQQDELLGYLELEDGPRGLWAQAYIHPAVEQTNDLLISFLKHVKMSAQKPLYFCVRSYQAGLSRSLLDLGFVLRSDQAVMVKRLTAAMRDRVPAPLPAIEGTQPEPTAPITPSSSAAQSAAENSIQNHLDSNVIHP